MTDAPVFGRINIDLKMIGQFLHVTSLELPGLHLCSEDHKAVMSDILPAIEFLRKHNK